MTDLTAPELAKVRALLAEREPLVGPVLEGRRITGGRSNLTYLISDGTHRWVLRRPPASGRTPSAHDVAREFRVTRALSGTTVPVPRPVLLCEDQHVLGAPFTIAEFVDGTTVQTRDELDELDDPTLGDAVRLLVETLASLHRIDYAGAGLTRFGRPDHYAARQLRRWAGQWDLIGTDDPDAHTAGKELIRLLEQSVPEQRATAIVHGDFRIDNTLLRFHPLPTLVAVVDWELSTIGDPVADVAMMCAYRHPAFDLVIGTRTAWTSERLPPPEVLAASYESAGGATLANWDFHLALAYFKIAVIAAGIDHRFHVGATDGTGFDHAGESVQHFFAAGLEVLGVAI